MKYAEAFEIGLIAHLSSSGGIPSRPAARPFRNLQVHDYKSLSYKIKQSKAEKNGVGEAAMKGHKRYANLLTSSAFLPDTFAPRFLNSSCKSGSEKCSYFEPPSMIRWVKLTD